MDTLSRQRSDAAGATPCPDALATVLEHLREAVAIADPGGTILWANAAHARLYGIARDRVRGMPVHRFSAAGVARQVEIAQLVRDAVLRRGSWSGRLDALRDDGVRVVTDTCISHVPCEQGEFWVCVHRDVTEQVALEEATLADTCREQMQLGVELHERLGQDIAGAAMLLRSLRSQLASGRSPDAALLGDVEQLLQQAVGRCRGLAQDITSFVIEDDGLGMALQRLAQRGSEGEGLRVQCSACPESAPLRGTEAFHVYRIVRLAIELAAQRAGSTLADVQAWREDDRLALAIVADGGEEPQRGADARGARLLEHWVRAGGGALETLEASAGRRGWLILLPIAQFRAGADYSAAQSRITLPERPEPMVSNPSR